MACSLRALVAAFRNKHSSCLKLSATVFQYLASSSGLSKLVLRMEASVSRALGIGKLMNELLSSITVNGLKVNGLLELSLLLLASSDEESSLRLAVARGSLSTDIMALVEKWLSEKRSSYTRRRVNVYDGDNKYNVV